jgi:methylenetetrahydrofolate dehydrogenase (NADP+) / methenyltetrahydrofolate cyclohydrolase
MGQLIRGKDIAARIHEKTATRVRELRSKGVPVSLAVFLVGDDKPSHTYVGKKGKAAASVGIDFLLFERPANITQEQLLNDIRQAQDDQTLTGLIVQLPLPTQLNTNAILNAIDPRNDVDCLTDVNMGKVVMKTNTLVPPTPGAVLSIVNDLNVDLVGKNVTIIGVGPLVGKPLAIMMMNERASVTTINSKTTDVKKKCLAADIIVTGVGKKGLLTAEMVRPGAIVIDTGVDFENGKMFGDVDVPSVQEVAAYVTPTPGGVGPITVARLLWNTVLCAQAMHES